MMHLRRGAERFCTPSEGSHFTNQNDRNLNVFTRTSQGETTLYLSNVAIFINREYINKYNIH